MDPFYFLNLEYKYYDTLNEISKNIVYLSNGNWNIKLEENEIIFNKKEYYSLEYDNDKKHLICKNKNNDTVDIFLISISKLSEH